MMQDPGRTSGGFFRPTGMPRTVPLFIATVALPVVFPIALAAQSLGRAPLVGDRSVLPPAGFRFRASSIDVNLRDRAAVVRFYREEYEHAARVPNGWQGSTAACRGSNSDAYRAATLRRMNYFRAMGGLPADVTFKDSFNREAEAAALMMSANRNLSHNPPSNWKCYTAAGKQGASHSNLSLGAAGPDAIDLYMRDPGAHNKEVGHRSWILDPALAVAGSGSTDGANALYVIGEFRKNASKPDFVAWPPAGFVPYQFGHSGDYRWSLHAGGVDLSSARVEVAADDGEHRRPLRTSIEHRSRGKVVWLVNLRGGKVAADQRYFVKVTAGGKTFEYAVVFIDPSVDGAGTIEENGGEEAEVAQPDTQQPSPARLQLLNRRLVRAVYKGETEAARKALEAGASPDAARKDWTALLLAAYYGRDEIARLLLERGADPARKVQGFDAVRLARARGHEDIARAIETKTGTRSRSAGAGGTPPQPPQN